MYRSSNNSQVKGSFLFSHYCTLLYAAMDGETVSSPITHYLERYAVYWHLGCGWLPIKGVIDSPSCYNREIGCQFPHSGGIFSVGCLRWLQLP